MNNTTEITEILENLAINQKKEVPELSCFEKQRVLNRTMAKINPEKAAKHRTLERTVLICAVCVMLITSAVAAAEFFNLDKLFYKYLSGSDTNVQLSGEDIMARDTSKGITVTAKQVIGDDYGFYAIFDVSVEDSAEKGAEFNNAEVEIKGAEVYQCSDIIRLRGENSNTFMLHIMSAENLQGKEIIVHLDNAGTGKIKDGTGLGAANAKWDLNWKIDYSNSAKSFSVSKPVSIYGGSALWESVSISPVSVSVKLADLNGTQTHCTDPNDLITVTMQDGSVFSSDGSEDTDILQDTDFITMSFNKIIDISKVKSVSFAGEVYKVK